MNNPCLLMDLESRGTERDQSPIQCFTPPTWETLVELLAPSFTLSQLMLKAFEEWSKDGGFALYLSAYQISTV